MILRALIGGLAAGNSQFEGESNGLIIDRGGHSKSPGCDDPGSPFGPAAKQHTPAQNQVTSGCKTPRTV
jgi:hypothetical protein